jgi:hypothetical protein
VRIRGVVAVNNDVPEGHRLCPAGLLLPQGCA